RAFADFKTWGIEIGWGWDRDCTPSALTLTNRSRGPFWMREQDAVRVQITQDGKAVTMDALASFLGIDPQAEQASGTLDYAMHDVAFWNSLTLALRAAKDG